MREEAEEVGENLTLGGESARVDMAAMEGEAVAAAAAAVAVANPATEPPPPLIQVLLLLLLLLPALPPGYRPFPLTFTHLLTAGHSLNTCSAPSTLALASANVLGAVKCLWG